MENYINFHPKNFDVYQHLKLNSNNKKIICECGNDPLLYCIICKTSFCEYCHIKEHINHTIISKQHSHLNEDDIKYFFNDIDFFLNDNPFFTKFNDVKNDLIINEEIFSNSLIEKIQMMKNKKIESINSIFNELSKCLNNMKNKIKNTKKIIKEYHSKYKNFFSDYKNDNTNTIFLLNFDIENLIFNKTNDIKNLQKTLKIDLDNFIQVEKKYKEYFNLEFNKLINDEKIIIEKIINDKKNKIKITEEIENDIIISNEKYFPFNHYLKEISKLNDDHFKEVKDRIEKYSFQIDNLIQKFSKLINEKGNLKDIEKKITQIENAKTKKAESLFSNRKLFGDQNRNILKKKKLKNLNSSFETEKPTLNNSTIISEENRKYKLKLNKKILNKSKEISLKNPIIKKYFDLLALDIYNKNFKIETKAFQSSFSDLNLEIKEEEESDVKIIEGTNIIIIYDKKNNKIIKKKLQLTLNPFGYTNFPFGVRTLFLRNKIYITGGKESYKEYKNVLIYDIQKNKLIRIIDLNISRSYHTIIYNDVFKTIMVFGGEKNNSVEIFDPITNKWFLLPYLNFPRANIFFHFDKPNGFLYCIFGIIGNISQYNYSDIIEFLDLTKLNEGWKKLNYYNRTDCNLKTYLNFFPLSNSLLLVYGSNDARSKKKIALLINLNKKEICKVDKVIAEQLIIESKKSIKLTSIMTELKLI